MDTLHVTDGPGRGRSFTLKDGITTVGRSPDNDIRISDREISRHHAKLLKRGSKILIVDLNSLGGVFVDRKKIEPGAEVEIKDDSILTMGITSLSFRDIGEASLVEDSLRNYTKRLEFLLKVSNIFAQSLAFA